MKLATSFVIGAREKNKGKWIVSNRVQEEEVVRAAKVEAEDDEAAAVEVEVKNEEAAGKVQVTVTE